MAAANKEFPWMSYYGNYNFFVRKLRVHDKVNGVETIDAKNGVYKIHLSDSSINVFICECYSFGMAEYYELLGKIDVEIDAIVINSNWCSYSSDVKEGEFKHEVRQFEKSYDNQQAEQISLMV